MKKLLLFFSAACIAIIAVTILCYIITYNSSTGTDAFASQRGTAEGMERVVDSNLTISKRITQEFFDGVEPLVGKKSVDTESLNRLTNTLELNYVDILGVDVLNGSNSVFSHSMLDAEPNHTVIGESKSKVSTLTPFVREIYPADGSRQFVYTILCYSDSSPITVAVDFDLEYLSNAINEQFPNNSTISITDSLGNLLYPIDGNAHAARVGVEEFITDRGMRDYGRGMFLLYGESETQTYTFTKTDDFVIYIRANYSGANNRNIYWMPATISILCAVVAMVIFALIAAKKIYHPIATAAADINRTLVGMHSVYSELSEDATMREFSENLAEGVDSVLGEYSALRYSDSVMRNIATDAFMRSLLCRNELPVEFVEKSIDLGLITANSAFFAVVIRANSIEEFERANPNRSLSGSLHLIASIAKDGFALFSHVFDYVYEGDGVVLVCSFPPDNAAQAQLRATYESSRVLDSAKRLAGLDVTLAVSDVYSSATEVAAAIRQAMSLSEYRVFRAGPQIFTTDSLPAQDGELSGISESVRLLLSVVRDGTLEEFQTAFDELWSILCRGSYEGAISILSYTAEMIYRMPTDSMQSEDDSALLEKLDVSDILREFSSAAQIREYFMQLFLLTESALSDMKFRKTPNIIESVVDYISKHYADNRLSANYVSDMLSITPQYFSKLFNEQLHTSFPDYVNNIRLEKARELLKSNPQISIAELCEAVGYNNRSYFTSSFTKKYGLSPGKYKSSGAFEQDN